MATPHHVRARIQQLKSQYEQLRQGKESLLTLIDEAELPENVYNSNAIENSTLTLPETEKILLEMEVSRNVSLREVFEAKNLAKVTEYLRQKPAQKLDRETILLLHKMLIGNIKDEIAGRFRQTGEYVRVGTHIAPAPEQIEQMIEQIILEFSGNINGFFSDRIAKFHLDFEHIHPFVDGNGRIGRVIINFQLYQQGFPPIIIRNKEKLPYYEGLRDFDRRKNSKPLEKIINIALMESLHKRITYLEGKKIANLTDYARKAGKSTPTILNAAKRQNIPAFREKGVWKIGE